MKPRTSKARTPAKHNVRLRAQREQRHWTQTELARMLGTTYLSVCRWENGTTSPSLYYRKQLCELFGMNPQDLGLVPSSPDEETQDKSLTSSPADVVVWNIPYRRNPFFTGREEILARLHTLLGSGRAATLSQAYAMSGLGGIGKTQTAVEYAYRYRQDYQVVLWVHAENRQVLEGDLLALAEVLQLPEKSEQNQARVLKAVKQWLSTHHHWLLILDNVEEVSLVDEMLPTECPGHILLTTREQATGAFAQRVDLEQMTPEEGALFLLHRIQLLGPDAPLQASSHADAAMQMVQLLGGLPLALDQAGAYIEETACSLSDYVERYQHQRVSLLSRRGRSGTGHDASVSTTFSLLAERLEQRNPAAIELLRLCAFLAPDAIPEELIVEGASDLGPVLGPLVSESIALDSIIADVRRSSLLRRNPDEKTLTIHRLVQAVIKDTMDEQLQRQWIERSVKLVSRAFPEGTFAVWPRGRYVVPQAQVCAELIGQYNLLLSEAARLLNNTGWYLLERALYTQSEPLLQQALTLKEQIYGPMHPDTATTFNNLAVLSFYQGHYEQAELFYQRALTIREQVLGPEHPETANTFDSLGVLYTNQGRYPQAEILLQKALAIEEKVLGPEHPDTTATLNNLALLYYEQGKYQEAEVLYQRVQAIEEKTLGPEHLFIAISLDNLAKLYFVQGRYEQAEALYQRALSMEKNVVGFNHPSTAITLANLGQLALAQGHTLQAESFYLHALKIKEQVIGLDHPDTAYTLAQLAEMYFKQGKDEQTETLYHKALAIQEKTPGPEHPQTATTLDGLASLYQKQGRYEQAELLALRALTICEQHLGTEHPQTRATRKSYLEIVGRK